MEGHRRYTDEPEPPWFSGQSPYDAGLHDRPECRPGWIAGSSIGTVNAAISIRAHVQIEQRTGGGVELISVDTRRSAAAAHWSELDPAGDLPLLARLARHYQLDHATLTTRGESPAGAGIAGSSALTIAACGALARWTGQSEAADDLLQTAMNVECQTIRVPTGVQDYRPALYGDGHAGERVVAALGGCLAAVEPVVPPPRLHVE